MNALQNIWEGLDWSVLTNMLLAVIPSLVCITIHELCHGLTAYALGDDTAKRQGRLSLNPIRHIDIFGLLMMLVFRFGWAKPVPIDMTRFKNPKRGMALTALAGPLSNLVLSCLVLFVYGMVYVPLSRAGTGLAGAVLDSVETMAYLSLALAVFNILPIPPLDGSKVVFSLLDEQRYAKLMRYERYGMLLLLVLMWSGVLRTPLSRAAGFVFDKLFIFAQWGYTLVN